LMIEIIFLQAVVEGIGRFPYTSKVGHLLGPNSVQYPIHPICVDKRKIDQCGGRIKLIS
jgi:hypothetical protein